VETPAQAQRLRVLDCDNAQGWHISFPCPAGDVTGVLRRLPRR